MNITIETLHTATDNEGCCEIEVTSWPNGLYRDGGNGEPRIELSISDPWHGDSETGFGATTNIKLSREQAAALAKVLADWVLAHG